jgi:peptidoglycan hydrolase CwlO-like protein
MKLDYKIIIIIVLLLGVVGMILFWPSKPSDFDQEEINRLRQENEQLLNQNDSLTGALAQKDNIILQAKEDIIDLQGQVNDLDSTIQNINNNRDETRDYVNSLDGNGIVRDITDYINRRKSKH